MPVVIIEMWSGRTNEQKEVLIKGRVRIPKNNLDLQGKQASKP
jgi:hypothetical protein